MWVCPFLIVTKRKIHITICLSQERNFVYNKSVSF